MSAQDLAELLNPVIHRELASIGALDTAQSREGDPGYVTIYRAAKAGKQANVEQMTSMLRAKGGAPTTTATAAELVLKMQAAMAEWFGTTTALRAMRATEGELVAQYAEAYDQVDGIVQKGLQKCWQRAIRHYTVLTAHIAKRGAHDVEERLALPQPLADYFAHDQARVCMRCLFDRPGRYGALERGEPHPYQYVCAACHEEVLSDVPPDILEKVKWDEGEREAHVIEKALSRPSKLAAESAIIAKLSGLAPDLPNPPMPYKDAFDVTGAPSATQPPAAVTMAGAAVDPNELLYTELLFDYASVRENW